MSEMVERLLEDVDDIENQLTDEEKHFRVTDDDGAEWCFGVIRDANAQIKKWKDFYTDRLEKAVKKQEARIAYMEFLLEGYFRTVPHDETKTQLNYKLPSGKLVLKKPALAMEHDDEQLLPWLRENIPALVKVKETPDWANLKKHLTIVGNQAVDPDGEIVPGVSVVEKPAEFKAEVK